MTTLMPNEDFKKLFRKQLISQHLLKGVALSFVSIALIVFFYFQTFQYVTILSNENLPIFLALSLFVILAIQQFVLAFQAYRKVSPHYSYTNFVDYQTEGLKVPATRIYTTSDTTSTIYMILEIDKDNIQLMDNRKRRLFNYLHFSKEETTFRFRTSSLYGLFTFQSRIDLMLRGKVKTTIYCIPEISVLLHDYLKSENYLLDVK